MNDTEQDLLNLVRTLAVVVHSAGGEIRVTKDAMIKAPQMVLDRFEDVPSGDIVFRVRVRG